MWGLDLALTGLGSLQGFLKALGADCSPCPDLQGQVCIWLRPPGFPVPDSCLKDVPLVLMLRFDSPLCPEQTTSSSFITPSGSATLYNIAEKVGASSLPPRNMSSVGSTVHQCDDQFVPGMQRKWDVVPSWESDT